MFSQIAVNVIVFPSVNVSEQLTFFPLLEWVSSSCECNKDIMDIVSQRGCKTFIDSYCSLSKETLSCCSPGLRRTTNKHLAADSLQHWATPQHFCSCAHWKSAVGGGCIKAGLCLFSKCLTHFLSLCVEHIRGYGKCLVRRWNVCGLMQFLLLKRVSCG